MPLSFPANPTVGQTSTQNGRTWTWSGSAWEINPATAQTLNPTFTGTLALSKTAGGAIINLFSDSNAGQLAQSGQTLYLSNYTASGTLWIQTTGTGDIALAPSGTVQTWVNESGLRVVSAGVAAIPSFARQSDSGTGLYWPALGAIGITASGVERWRITAAGEQSSVVPGGSTLLPAFQCRAWVNFAGLAATIRGSGNVSSVTRTAAGSYTINFTTAMADANYCAVISSRTTSSNVNRSDQIASGNTSGVLSTTSLPVSHVENGTAADTNFMMVAVFR